MAEEQDCGKELVELVCEPGLVPELGVGMPLEVKLLRPVEMVEAPSSSSVPMPNVKLNKYSITSTRTAAIAAAAS